MSSFTTSEELYGYLDKISRLYPGGIPRSSIPEAKPEATTVKPRCALFYMTASGDAVEQLSILAEAICTKGLRVPLEQCVVRSIEAIDVTGDGLAQLVRQANSPVVVLCGSSLPAGKVSEVEGAVVLTSFSLEQVGQNADLKRQFWEHLKLVIPRIPNQGGV
jgi:hypothetical protein